LKSVSFTEYPQETSPSKKRSLSSEGDCIPKRLAVEEKIACETKDIRLQELATISCNELTNMYSHIKNGKGL